MVASRMLAEHCEALDSSPSTAMMIDDDDDDHDDDNNNSNECF